MDDSVRLPTCSIGRAMDILGERWTLLILRECFYGVRRFSVMQRNLGIARNILSARLQLLVRTGILEKRRYQEEPERFEYRLTREGPRRSIPPSWRSCAGATSTSARTRPARRAAPHLRRRRRPGDGLLALPRGARPARRHARARGRAPASVGARFQRPEAERERAGHRAAAVGRRDHEGRRELPRLGRARAASPVVRWLGRIKGAAARANAELGLLDADARRADRRRRRRDRRGRARRPVPDRRLPDRLGHVVEHERQRGASRRSPATARTRTTT